MITLPHPHLTRVDVILTAVSATLELAAVAWFSYRRWFRAR